MKFSTDSRITTFKNLACFVVGYAKIFLMKRLPCYLCTTANFLFNLVHILISSSSSETETKSNYQMMTVQLRYAHNF